MKEYTPEQIQDLTQQGKTQGRKGFKAPRICITLKPDTIEYIKSVSKAENLTYSQIIDRALRKDMADRKGASEG